MSLLRILTYCHCCYRWRNVSAVLFLLMWMMNNCPCCYCRRYPGEYWRILANMLILVDSVGYWWMQTLVTGGFLAVCGCLWRISLLFH